jgi:hypothetical protein
MRRYPDAPCGTHGGYVRHVKYGETPCDGCREGHRRYMSEYRRANPKKRDKDMTASQFDLTATTVDPDELAEWNRGTQRAILANRDRDARENLLDSLHTWRWRG